MKVIKFLIVTLIMSFMVSNLNAQRQELSTDSIRLHLDGLDKFGKQHRLGNHLILGGVVVTGIGIFSYSNNLKNNLAYKNPTQKNTYEANRNASITVITIGSLLSTAGFVINLDSFRHLNHNPKTE